MQYMNMLLRAILFGLIITNPIMSMQNPKPQETIWRAASNDNLAAIRGWIQEYLALQKRNPQKFQFAQLIDQKDKKFEQTPLSWAARNGKIAAVDLLLSAGANPNIPDADGLTPLAWASIQLNPNEPYLAVIERLIKGGANVNAVANDGLTILHKAAASGNIPIIRYLLDHGAIKDINAEGSKEKGRTPIGEAVRASKDAVIHVDMEKENFTSYPELLNALPGAIAQLEKKEAKKLSTQQIVDTVNLLKQYGAKPNIKDALGHTLDYYINEVQLISENDRQALLNALGYPFKPRQAQFAIKNLPEAINNLEPVYHELEQHGIGQKVRIAQWILQNARDEKNQKMQYDKLRIAMSMFAKIKEEAKDKIRDPRAYNAFEQYINTIRDIVRDTALVLIGKAIPNQAPVQPKVTPPALPIATQQTQITPPVIVQDINYAFYFVNQTRQEPLLVTLLDRYNDILFQQQIGLSRETQMFKIPATSLPIKLQVYSENKDGVVSGSLPLTTERLQQELQKIGIQVPSNYRGEIVVVLFIYKDKFIVKGTLAP